MKWKFKIPSIPRWGKIAAAICAAADALKSGEVFDLGREGNLSAESALFDYQNGFICPAGIQGGGQPCRAAADNYDIIHKL